MRITSIESKLLAEIRCLNAGPAMILDDGDRGKLSIERQPCWMHARFNSPQIRRFAAFDGTSNQLIVPKTHPPEINAEIETTKRLCVRLRSYSHAT